MIAKLKSWFLQMQKRKTLDIQEFTQRHRNYIVFVCDPKDDSIFVAYRGKHVAGRMRSNDGLNHHVLKNMMRHSTFDREIDRFIGGLMEVSKIPLKIGNVFYSFLDGALFNISKAIKQDKDS